MSTLISRNPATGETLQSLEQTATQDLPTLFHQARQAQVYWGALPLKQRVCFLLHLREVLLNHLDEIASLISKENGKPQFEAMTNELIPSLDMLTFFAKKAPKLLKDRTIPMQIMKHRTSYINYWPVGVVAIISPWNYPFLLPFADVFMALVAGNAVIFKPSEITPLVGLKIQELCNEAGLPPFVLQTVIGDGPLGAAIIQQKPNKIFFTGSVNTGKKIMAAAAEHLIPVNLELGGKDAMIVLADADLDFATSAALWGSFSNSGQVCASVERILVHERVAQPFLNQLKDKVAQLRPLDPTLPDAFANDLGVLTYERQKAVYTKHLEEAKAKNAQILTGGHFSEDQRALRPTIVTGPEVENLEIYNEETFGPVVAVTTFKSIAEAVEKTNRNRYGLVASIITPNLHLAEEIAKQLAVGTVTINEVVYTAGLGETPWGGVKESGFGRTHSEAGLHEFVNIRHIHKPKFQFLVFKSLWWFPYGPFQYNTFRQFAALYRRSWIAKLKAIPDFLWNFVKFIKNEKRI